MTTGGIIMTFALILWFTLISLHSRSENRNKHIEEEQKARQRAAKEKEKQEDLSFISSVANLPDSEVALTELVARFGWYQIVGVLGIGLLEFRILQSIRHEKNISLPNMQADRYGNIEHHVVQGIRKAASPYDNSTDISCIEEIDYVGTDHLAQEPTAKMLSELVQSGYIRNADKITNNCRDFECELTSKGSALLNLNNRFGNGKLHVSKRPLYEEERKVIREVIQLRIQ